MSEQIPGDRFFEFAKGSSYPPLTEGQKQILDFAGKNWSNAGERENDIRSTFGYDSTRFFHRLHSLKDHPEAVAYAPTVMRRVNEVIERSRESGRRGRGYL